MNTTPQIREANADIIRERVAANLTAELRRQRWSDRAAATALGLTNVYVSRRTSGTVELSASDLSMFAEFLNVTIETFYTEHAPAKVTQLAPTANSRRRDYSNGVSILPEDHEAEIVQLADVIAARAAS